VAAVGDGAEWIWNRAAMSPNRCEILDFWQSVGETSGPRDGPARSRQKLWRQAARRGTIVAHSGTEAGTPMVLVRSP